MRVPSLEKPCVQPHGRLVEVGENHSKSLLFQYQRAFTSLQLAQAAAPACDPAGQNVTNATQNLQNLRRNVQHTHCKMWELDKHDVLWLDNAQAYYYLNAEQKLWNSDLQKMEEELATTGSAASAGSAGSAGSAASARVRVVLTTRRAQGLQDHAAAPPGRRQQASQEDEDQVEAEA